MKNISRVKDTFKVLLLASAVAVVFASCMTQEPRLPVPLTASETKELVPARATDSTFAVFSHEVPEHKEFDCVSCHRRETEERDLQFAAHDSCVGCHLNEFIDEKTAMCAICHDRLDTVPPTMLPFPDKFKEGFNMKFEHAAHISGDGLPPNGCVSCHLPAGAGKSIPVGIKAHNNCYTCHTPDTPIGSCNTCHALAPYSRTPPSRYVFRAVFSHNDHGPRQGVSCNECHTVRAGMPQGSQVTNPVADEHNFVAGVSCRTCHNGRRAFGGNGANDFANCARCHKGSGFSMLPAGTAPDE